MKLISVGLEMGQGVSAIIPTHNKAHYASSAIQSVLNKAFGDFEILAVDGASTDDTGKVIHKFEDKKGSLHPRK